MNIIYKGMKIDSKIEEKRIEQLLHDDKINRVTKITVKIPEDNYSLTLVPSVDHITDEGLVSWGDNTGGYLNDASVHVYEKAGVYDISGHFTFGLGLEPTESMKECLVEVKNLTEVSEDLSNAFTNCIKLVKFDCVTEIFPTNMYFMFHSCNNIININLKSIKTDNVTNMRAVFYGCRLLTSLDVSHFNTTNVTTIRYMFAHCNNLVSLDVSNWNTMNIEDMSAVFYECHSLTSLDVSKWNVDSVIEFSATFNNCKNLSKIDVSSWTVKNAERLDNMFCGCKSITSLDVSNFNTSKVTNVASMFRYCDSLEYIYGMINWNTTNIKYLSNTFNGCIVLQNIDAVINFDTQNVYSIDGLFKNCKSITSVNLSNFNTSSIQSMKELFEGCDGLTEVNLSGMNLSINKYTTSMFKDCINLESIQGIEDLNVSNIRNMDYMFYGCEKLANLNLSNWTTTTKLTSMKAMFYGCKALTSLDVSGFNVSNVTDIVGVVDEVEYGLFDSCESITEIVGLDSWNTGNVNNMLGVFRHCAKLTSANVANWNTSKVTNMGDMFYNCQSLTSLDVSNFDTSNVTDMYRIFYNCRLLTSLDVNEWDVGKVERTTHMFNSCRALTSLDLSKWDTSNLINIGAMFSNMTSIKSINVTGWDVNNVERIQGLFQNGIVLTEIVGIENWNFKSLKNTVYAFYNCNKLTSLDLSNWDTSNVTDMNGMFAYCYELENLNVSGWVTSNVTRMDYMFTTCQKLQKLDLGTWSARNVTNMDRMFYYCQKLETLGDTTYFNPEKVTNMNQMFYNCQKLEEIRGIGNWVTGELTDIAAMFANCNALKYLDLGGFNVSKVVNPCATISDTKYGLFYECESVEVIEGLENWDTSSMTDMQKMFYNCKNLRSVNVGDFNTKNVRGINQMFRGCNNLTSLDVSKWDTSKVASIENMFAGCNNLTSLDVSKWDTSNVTAMCYTFFGCSNLTELDLSNWDTSNVTNYYGTSCMFYDCRKLVTIGNVGNWDTRTITNMSAMFHNCNKLTSLDVSNWDTSNVTDMNNMFNVCQSLTSLDVSNWDTGKVANMQSMFNGCSTLTSLDISNWDTGNVIYMNNMFGNCTLIDRIDLSGINVSKVTNLHFMFGNCSNLVSVNLSGWNTESLLQTSQMFYACTKLEEIIGISNLNTTKLQDTSLMFHNCQSIVELDLSGWSTPNLKEMSIVNTNVRGGTFSACYALENIIFGEGWSTSKVTNMSSMFDNCYKLTSIDLSHWNTDNVTNMSHMFNNCKSLTTLDVSNFNTSNVTNMYCMFNGCHNLSTLDVSNFDTIKVTDMRFMFNGCHNLSTLDVSNFDTSKVTDMRFMFCYCQSLTSLDVSGFNTSNVTNMANMFRDCVKLETLTGLNNFDVSKVTHMNMLFNNLPLITSLDLSSWNTDSLIYTTNDNENGGMFSNCSKLQSIAFGEGWNTSQVTNMKYMFANCKELVELDVSNFNTSNVTNMAFMFNDCNKLTSLDVSNFNTSKVINMEYMFRGCHLLTELDVDDWDTSNVERMNGMFHSCFELSSVNVSNWNTESLIDTTLLFCQCYKLQVIDVSNWNTISLQRAAAMFYVCGSIQSLDLSRWNTSKLNKITYVDSSTVLGLFNDCNKLETIKLPEAFIDNKITDLQKMFYGCKSLTSVNITNWDTSNVTSMGNMFENCQSLTSLDVSNFNTSKVNSLDSMFNNCYMLESLDVSNWNTREVTNMTNVFNNCRLIESLDVSKWDTSNVNYIYAMFHNCFNLTSLDVSNFNTSNVKNIHAFLHSTKLTTINISKFDLSKALDSASNMFSSSDGETEDVRQSLKTLYFTEIDLPTTVDFSNMFTNRTGLKYIQCNNINNIPILIEQLPVRTADDPGFFVTNAAYTDEMNTALAAKYWNFINLSEIENVIVQYKYDTDICRDMLPVFNPEFTGYFWSDVVEDEENPNIVTRTIKCIDDGLPTMVRFGYSNAQEHKKERESLLALLYLNTDNLTTCYNMFAQCTNLTSINVSNWNTSNVTNMYCMFYYCNNLTSLDVSNWDTSNVTRMDFMFYGCNNLTSLDVSNFNTSKVTDMVGMFYNCNNLTSLDVSNFDTSNVINMRNMFYNCKALTSLDVSNFDTSKVTDMSDMFRDCQLLTSLDVSNWDNSNVTRMDGMFRNCINLTSLDVSNFNTSKVTAMNNMFQNCNKLTSLDVSNWNTSNVTNMSTLFASCLSLTSLDVSNWDTSNVTYMSYIFHRCYSLTSLDVSNFNTSKVTDMRYMFGHCEKLTSLSCANFDMQMVNQVHWMFNYMISLKVLDLTHVEFHADDYQEILLDTNNLEVLKCDKPSTIHKLAEYLPDRSELENPGKLITTVEDRIDMYVISLLTEKNWEITSEVGLLVADYIFDPAIYNSMIPVMNDGYLDDCIIEDEVILNYVEPTDEVEVNDYENEGIMTLEENEGRMVIRRKIYNLKGEGPSEIRFGALYDSTLVDQTYPETYFWRTSLLEVNYVNITNVTSMYSMFYRCLNVHTIKGLDVRSNVTNLGLAFCICEKLTSLDVSNWDTSKVVSIHSVFNSCKNLTSLDVSNWDTSNMWTISCAFLSCNKLTSLDVSKWDTSNVQRFELTFANCFLLTSLDLSSWDIKNAIQIFELFRKNTLLETLDISNFIINDGCDISNVFIDSSKLKYLKLDDVASLELILPELPTKSADNQGHLVVYNPDALSSTAKTTLANKNWVVHSVDECIVAAYGFDNTVHNDLMPIFNEDYDTSALVISDHVHDGWFTHRDIMNFEGKLPSTIKFGGDEPDDRTNALMQIGDINLTGITDYSEMFKNCTNLNYLNICVGEKIPTNVSHMFEGCSNLELFDIYRMEFDGITSYEGMFAGCNKLCKIRVKDIQNEIFMNILNDENNNFAEGDKTLVSSHIHDLSQEEVGVLEGLGWTLRGMVAHYAYDTVIASNYLPEFNEEFTDYEVYDYLNERQGVMHRTIESDMLPTYMRFGCPINGSTDDITRAASILEIYDAETREVTNGHSMFNHCKKLVKIDCGLHTGKMTKMNYMMYHCENLTSLDVSNWDVSNVKEIHALFDGCYSLTSLDVSNWDTSNVTDMSQLFYGCINLTSLDLSKWDTSNVTYMQSMFQYCNNLTSLDLSKWDTSNVTDMNNMFCNCQSLTSLDVSNFDTSNVTDFTSIFNVCKNLTNIDVSRWDVSKVGAKPKGMRNTFGNCINLQRLSLYNWSKLHYLYGTNADGTVANEFIFSQKLEYIDFNNCSIPAYELKWLNTPILKCIRVNMLDSLMNLINQISDRTELEQGTIISDAELSEETLAALAAKNWTVVTSDSFIKVAEYVYDPDVWASLIPEFNAEFISYFIDDEEIEGEAADGTVKTLIKRTIWSLGELPTMMRFGRVESDISTINQEPSKSLLEVIYLNTTNIATMQGMFRICYNVNDINCTGWDTSKVYRTDYMFANCNKLTTIDVSSFDTSNVWAMRGMFENCKALTSLDVSNFNTNNVTNMAYMFFDCNNLTSLDVSNFNTSNVTDMASMFRDCYNLTSLDVSNFDTSNVTDMNRMFCNCNNLTSLDVSNFNTSNVTNMDSMFYKCYKLTSLDVSNFNTSNVTRMDVMFNDCIIIKEIKGIENFNVSKVVNMIAMFDSCRQLTSLNLGNWVLKENVSIERLFSDDNNIGMNLEYVDISNFKLDENNNVTNLFLNAVKLTDIGMVHCDVETINIVAAQTPVQPITIWIGTHLTADEIASLDQYDHITYSVQLENAARLMLTSPLLEGDSIEVVDGQLCHIHNTGMDVFDGSSDEGWILGSVGTNDYRIELYSDVAFTRNYNWSENNSIGFAICDKIPRLSNTEFVKLPLDAPFVSILDRSGSVVCGCSIKITRKNANTLAEGKAWLAKNPLTLIYSLETPWIEVIDLPRANIDVELYENGVLYMSDPTASIVQEESDTNLIINEIQGDSVVNVSNQQFPIELSEETSTPIQTGEITEANGIRPKFYGRTMVNLIDRINWAKFINETNAGYSYDSNDITAKTVTITNFNDKPIYVQINNLETDVESSNQLIEVNATVNITIDETSYLASIYGLVADGWNEINIHEIRNVNIFEGELSEDELPENRMSGMRNVFDKYKTSEGKYRVEMVVSNSPIQFGKAGRK